MEPKIPEDSPPLRNGTEDSYNLQDLRKQIDALKKVILDKNIQLNMVIKNAEDKYHDIHKNYRDLAIQLHESWQHKYNQLEERNKELSSNTTDTQHETKQQNESNTDNVTRNGAGSPLTNAIDDITQSLFTGGRLNRLSGGNIDDMSEITKDRMMNGHNNTKVPKPKIRKRVVETYID
eukprot:265450_1